MVVLPGRFSGGWAHAVALSLQLASLVDMRRPWRRRDVSKMLNKFLYARSWKAFWTNLRNSIIVPMSTLGPRRSSGCQLLHYVYTLNRGRALCTVRMDRHCQAFRCEVQRRLFLFLFRFAAMGASFFDCAAGHGGASCKLQGFGLAYATAGRLSCGGRGESGWCSDVTSTYGAWSGQGFDSSSLAFCIIRVAVFLACAFWETFPAKFPASLSPFSGQRADHWCSANLASGGRTCTCPEKRPQLRLAFHV